MICSGTCYLIGGGPGDPGLLTLRAKELLEQAEVVVYDSLVNDRILNWIPASAERFYAGKRANKHVMKQVDINALLISKCQENKAVIRLKGGDPFIFGRGGEEAEALSKAGIPFEVVPGVTSGIAAPAYAGIPLTHREHSTSVTFVTGHECPKESGETDWAKLAALGGTLVIYMGVKNLPNIASNLIHHGMDKNTPAAFIQWGCDPRQKSLSATVSSLPSLVHEAGLSAPAIIVIGHVARLHESIPWFSQKPLLGQKILVTRTRSQNSQLKTLLEDEGAYVVEMPLIKIQNSKFKIQNCSTYPWLVFTSPNAVDIFLREITRQSDLRALGSCKIAVVGQATADELTKWHLKADFMPSRFDALTLTSEWPLEAYGQSVLFPCGSKAGKAIENGLKEKGCKVTRLEIYETSPDPRARDIWENHQDADWILFCSSSAVESFIQLNPDPLPATLKTASIGPQTSASLRQHHLPVHREATEATLDSLLQSLLPTFTP
jgi:uroporphyrinogen III methyltransferase / synthase